MTLQRYITEASRLLHDTSFLFTSQTELIDWINTARRQTAELTGCVRRLVSGQSAFGGNSQAGSFVPGGAQPGALPGAFSFFSGLAVTGAAVNSLQTIPGQERYPFQGFFNPYLQQAHQGCQGIVDVNACSVSWGGASRPALIWMPWEDLQAYARSIVYLNMSYPAFWAVMNDGEQGEIWLFPPPSTTGDIELDAYCIPTELYTDSDFEAIPGGFRSAIKYGAAGLAYLTSQRYSQAQVMMDLFHDRLGVARVAVDRGKVPNYYAKAFS